MHHPRLVSILALSVVTCAAAGAQTPVPAQPLFPGSSTGASGLFLQVGRIKGGSTNAQYKDWIEADAFALDVSTTLALGGGGSTTGKATFSDLSVTSPIGPAMPELSFLCANGTRIQDATLVLVQQTPSGPFVAMEIKLTGVFVVSVGQSGDAATESMVTKLGYEVIQWTQRTMDPTGKAITVTRFWDRLKNSGG